MDKIKALSVAGIISTMFFAGCSIQVAPTKGDVKTVLYDEGGSISVREEEIAALAKSGTRVEIIGTCISTCTMYLSLPNTCVAPDATLGFHGATEVLFVPATPYNKLRYDRRMAAHYPPNLHKWFMTEGRDLIILWHSKTGQEVHDMDPGYVRLCSN